MPIYEKTRQEAKDLLKQLIQTAQAAPSPTPWWYTGLHGWPAPFFNEGLAYLGGIVHDATTINYLSVFEPSTAISEAIALARQLLRDTIDGWSFDASEEDEDAWSESWIDVLCEEWASAVDLHCLTNSIDAWAEEPAPEE